MQRCPISQCRSEGCFSGKLRSWRFTGTRCPRYSVLTPGCPIFNLGSLPAVRALPFVEPCMIFTFDLPGTFRPAALWTALHRKAYSERADTYVRTSSGFSDPFSAPFESRTWALGQVSKEKKWAHRLQIVLETTNYLRTIAKKA